jgi:hypothetical protein
LKESGHVGTDIQGVMPCPPGFSNSRRMTKPNNHLDIPVAFS